MLIGTTLGTCAYLTLVDNMYNEWVSFEFEMSLERTTISIFGTKLKSFVFNFIWKCDWNFCALTHFK